MDTTSDIQKRQEELYDFPYHYLPHFRKGRFCQVRSLRWGYEYLSYIDFVLGQLAPCKFESLLDVGCGDGRFLHEAKQRFEKTRLVGVDISDRAIQYAKAFNPDLEFHAANITQGLPVQEQFDIVTCIDTLEHIPQADMPAFTQSLHRCLNDTGALVVTVPSSNLPVSRKHFQHFDLESLGESLGPHFRIKESFYLNQKSRWVRLLHFLLTNSVFMLNQKYVVNWLFGVYRRRFLPATADNGTRICVICEKNGDSPAS